LIAYRVSCSLGPSEGRGGRIKEFVLLLGTLRLLGGTLDRGAST